MRGFGGFGGFAVVEQDGEFQRAAGLPFAVGEVFQGERDFHFDDVARARGTGGDDEAADLAGGAGGPGGEVRFGVVGAGRDGE